MNFSETMVQSHPLHTGIFISWWTVSLWENCKHSLHVISLLQADKIHLKGHKVITVVGDKTELQSSLICVSISYVYAHFGKKLMEPVWRESFTFSFGVFWIHVTYSISASFVASHVTSMKHMKHNSSWHERIITTSQLKTAVTVQKTVILRVLVPSYYILS